MKTFNSFCVIISFLLISSDRLSSQIENSDTISVQAEIIENAFLSGSQVFQKDFNKGVISDPLLLIQGRIPGVQIYNRGSDPNVQSLGRIRGISSLDMDIEPLIVIDGVPNSYLESIDPNDIESINVLKDGFSQSKYGARGANGVIEITRKKSKENSPLNVSYSGMFGASTLSKEVEVLDAQAFINRGGTDLGSDFDYQSSIRRTGISQVHSLSIDKGYKNINFRLSGNYRNINGVLKESGFEQFNGNAQVNFNLFNDKLKVYTNHAITSKKQNLSFVEAFRFASTRNPTAPNLGIDAPFEYDEESFGGYFETIGLFDSFNPQGMIELNERINNISLVNMNYGFVFELIDGFSIGSDYSYQNRFSGFREFGGSDSFFKRSSNDLTGDIGSGTFLDLEDRFQYSNSYLSYTKKNAQSAWTIEGGYTYQDFNFDSDRIDIRLTNNDDLVNVEKVLDYDWVNEGSPSEYNGRRRSDKLVSFYNRIGFVNDDKLFLDIGLRYEGSSLYREDDKWHFYPSARFAYDLGSITNQKGDRLLVSTGFGISSSRVNNFDIDPQFEFFLTEKKQEYNLGLEYIADRFSFEIGLYSNKVSNANFNIISGPDNTFGEIKTNGLDLSLGLDIIDNNSFQYSTDFIFSTYNSKLGEVPFNQFTTGSPGGPGFGSTQIIRLKPNENYGEIFAPVYKNVDQNGLVVYEDINNDGQLIIFSPQDPLSDYAVVGNAIPDFEIGWVNNFKVQDIDIRLFFRGAFGHSLLNVNRLFYESNSLIDNLYNSVVTSKSIDGLIEARYSSLYVENASFLKLDNLSVSKSFTWGAKKRKVQISLVSQNLLTITGYTGVDPEPSFFDYAGGGYFVPGVDRRSTYRPSRTISLGVNVDIF